MDMQKDEEIASRIAQLTGSGLSGEELVEATESVRALNVKRDNKKRAHCLETQVSDIGGQIEVIKSLNPDADTSELEKKLEMRKEKLTAIRRAGKGRGELDMTKEEILQSRDALAMTRNDVDMLFKALNLDINVSISKKDTGKLLAALLTCSEAQLNYVMDDVKVPIVIKTVIKRLLQDMAVGSTAGVEMLWDKIFGKGCFNDVNNQSGAMGIIPDAPISRQGYELIIERIIGRKVD